MQDHPTEIAAQIESIIRREFNPLRLRVPKSDPYIEGFRAGLVKQLIGRDTPLPYRAGTADADAYLAGKEEGRHYQITAPASASA
jgi:hypothetical protein